MNVIILLEVSMYTTPYNRLISREIIRRTMLRRTKWKSLNIKLIGFPPEWKFHSFYLFTFIETWPLWNKSSSLRGHFSEWRWGCEIKCWSISSLQFNLKQRKVQIHSTGMWEFCNILAFVSTQIHSIKGLIVEGRRISTIRLYKYRDTFEILDPCIIL